MNRSIALTLCCSMTLIGGCSNTDAPATAGTVCAESDFNAFLSRFSDDVTFQRGNTAAPMQKLMVDSDALPEPKPVETSETPAPDEYPLYPGASQIAAETLHTEIAPTNRGHKVRLSKPDTDISVVYFFEQRPCWTLVRMEDWSL